MPPVSGRHLVKDGPLLVEQLGLQRAQVVWELPEEPFQAFSLSSLDFLKLLPCVRFNFVAGGLELRCAQRLQLFHFRLRFRKRSIDGGSSAVENGLIPLVGFVKGSHSRLVRKTASRDGSRHGSDQQSGANSHGPRERADASSDLGADESPGANARHIHRNVFHGALDGNLLVKKQFQFPPGRT